MLVKAPNHRHSYCFFSDQHGEKQSFQLGKVSSGDGKRTMRHVHHLVITRAGGPPCRPDTRRWLNEEGSRYAEQLIKFGLAGVFPVLMKR